MAKKSAGKRYRVGSLAPETGQYRHSGCVSAKTFKKGDKLPRCVFILCLKKRSGWILKEKLA
jgi:hypothetical protein